MSEKQHMAETQVVDALPASSIVVVRDDTCGLEVLMIERAKTMRFAPGAFVFPGGKVDARDQSETFWEGLINCENSLPDLSYRLAGLRELYEEASVLITDNPVSAATTNLDFVERLKEAGARLNVADMVPFAHWVTPEPMPRRFDTHFYIVAHNGEEACHDGNEAISLRWVRPKAILEDWGDDKVPLMFPTRLNLMKLARASTVAEALEQSREADVVRTLPVIGRDSEGIKLTIDRGAGYGVTQASAKELRVETPK